MASPRSSFSDSEHRVVRFRRPGRVMARHVGFSVPSPVEDLTKFERSEAPDDYRHRMLMNVVAFLFVLMLMGIGLWLADTIAIMRKNQDCVLSGRSGCTPVEVNHSRW